MTGKSRITSSWSPKDRNSMMRLIKFDLTKDPYGEW